MTKITGVLLNMVAVIIYLHLIIITIKIGDALQAEEELHLGYNYSIKKQKIYTNT